MAGSGSTTGSPVLVSRDSGTSVGSSERSRAGRPVRAMCPPRAGVTPMVNRVTTNVLVLGPVTGRMAASGGYRGPHAHQAARAGRVDWTSGTAGRHRPAHRGGAARRRQAVDAGAGRTPAHLAGERVLARGPAAPGRRDHRVQRRRG